MKQGREEPAVSPNRLSTEPRAQSLGGGRERAQLIHGRGVGARCREPDRVQLGAACCWADCPRLPDAQAQEGLRARKQRPSDECLGCFSKQLSVRRDEGEGRAGRQLH